MASVGYGNGNSITATATATAVSRIKCNTGFRRIEDFLADGEMGALVGAMKAHMYAYSTYPAYYGGSYDALHPPQNP